MYVLEVITYLCYHFEGKQKASPFSKEQFPIIVPNPKILLFIHALYCVGITPPLRTLPSHRGYILSFQISEYE